MSMIVWKLVDMFLYVDVELLEDYRLCCKLYGNNKLNSCIKIGMKELLLLWLVVMLHLLNLFKIFKIILNLHNNN